MLKNLISLQIKILIINFKYKDQIEAPGERNELFNTMQKWKILSVCKK